MPGSAIDIYVTAFESRCRAGARPGERVIHEPGVRGLIPDSEGFRSRLLVTDDRAHEALAALLPQAGPGTITVFDAAVRCRALVDADSRWSPGTATAMSLLDLRTVPSAALPDELTRRPVRRRPDDPAGGVDLLDAAAAAIGADPSLKHGLDELVDYLRSLPSEIRLFAAVDAEGVVRATSGSGAFGGAASVIFVNTDPEWRGRGIGRAMTAAALHAARASGARSAGLDASDDGARIYLRLGFELVSPTVRFVHRPPRD